MLYSGMGGGGGGRLNADIDTDTDNCVTINTPNARDKVLDNISGKSC